MPTFEVTAPDGKVYDVTAPEGASQAQVLAYAKSQFGKQQRRPDNSTARGLALGAQKPLDNLVNAAMQIPGAQALDDLGQRMGLPGARDAVTSNQQARADNTAKGAQLVGNIAGTLPTLALPGSPVAGQLARIPVVGAAAAKALTGVMAQGAVGGALLSDADTAQGVAADAGLGAVAGKAGQMLVGGVGKVIAPKLSDAAARLQAMGVKLTPGRAAGSVASRVEDLASKLPVVNLTAPTAMKGMQQDFARGVVNKALEPIGGKLPSNVGAGYSAIDAANTQLSNAYAKIVPSLTAQIDKQFVQRVNVLRQRASLTADADNLFETELKRVVMDAFDPKTGIARGKALKGLDERLGKLAAGYSRSQDFAEREVGELLGDVREQVFSLVARSAPKAASELRKVNRAYAMFKRVQRATAQASDAEGVFTPAQFRAAVRAADRSKDKGAFARGRALMQQEAADGVNVIPEKVADSGTSERVLTGLGGVAALTTGINPGLVAGAGVLALPYTRAGMSGVNALLRPAGPIRQGASNAIQRSSRAAPVAVPALLARRDN